MKRLIFGVLIAGVALLAATLSVSATPSFTVHPWAYACSTTHYGNPASNTDPGPTCDHNGTEAGLGTGYCGDPQGSDVDSPGTVSSTYTAGKLTLTKVGLICDDMASGASIEGLSTLTSASALCLTTATCNPGGNLRLNVVDSTGKLHFIGGTMNVDGLVSFNVAELEGLTLKSIDILADNPGTVALSNLTFTGASTPAPTATPTATAHPTSHPTTVPALAQTGGGAGSEDGFIMTMGLLIVVGIALVGIGVFTLVRGKP